MPPSSRLATLVLLLLLPFAASCGSGDTNGEGGDGGSGGSCTPPFSEGLSGTWFFREIGPATGNDYVLAPAELDALIAAAKKIRDTLEPARDPAGNPRAWDIEFGFAKGKLWLFQVRPFIGNEEVQNVPALAALDGTGSEAGGTVSLGERVK